MQFSTERCYIRNFQPEDIDAFMEYRNNSEWMKFQSFKGLTKEEYETALLGNQTLSKGMQLAVLCKSSDILIGDIYLQAENDECWLGFTVIPPKSKQGYMFEVASAAIAQLRKMGVQTVNAGVETGNDASISLLKKLNFTYSHFEDGENVYKLTI